MSVVMLALKGITVLCKEGVIDIMTTVKVLSPKFKNDTRVPILAKFYQLLAVAPTFDLASEAYQDFLKSTLAMMWNNVNTGQNGQIKAVIVDAMKAFNIELHELHMLPDYAKAGVEAPEEGAEHAADDIPGECWIKLVKHNKTESAYEALLAALVKEEVANLPRGVHHLSQSMKNRGEEHANLNFLPDTSILKSIMTHLAQDKDEELNKALFKILSTIELPLPPFDWRLLQMTKKNKFFFIGVLAKQCSRSHSAKAILQDFTSKWSIGEIALDLMPHFAHIVKGVRLSDHALHESLELWYQSASRDSSCLNGFKALLKSFIEVVNDTSITEEEDLAVKETVTEAILRFHKQLLVPGEADSEIVEFFHKAVIDLPHYVVEKLADDQYNVASTLMIRKNLAVYKKQPSLAAMNGIIDLLAKEDFQNLVEMQTLKSTLIEVFKVTKAKQLKQWILEIMGQILFLLRQNCSVWTFNFMFEVFVFSVAALAENGDPEVDSKCLPLGLTNLLRIDKYADLGPHFAEWLMELEKKETTVSDACKAIIRQSWSAVKVTEGYKESSVWGRLCLI